MNRLKLVLGGVGTYFLDAIINLRIQNADMNGHFRDGTIEWIRNIRIQKDRVLPFYEGNCGISPKSRISFEE